MSISGYEGKDYETVQDVDNNISKTEDIINDTFYNVVSTDKLDGRKIKYNGKIYKDLKTLFEEYKDFDRRDFEFGRELGLNTIEALDYCMRNSKKYKVAGRYFKDIEEACKIFGANIDYLIGVSDVTGMSLEGALEFYIKRNKIKEKTKQEAVKITVNIPEHTYNSEDDYRQAIEWYRAYDFLNDKDAAFRAKFRTPVEFNGEKYSDMFDVLREYDITSNDVLKRCKKFGETFEKALNMIIMLRTNVIMDDTIFENAYEAVNFYKLNFDKVSRYVSKNNVDYYEAIQKLR